MDGLLDMHPLCLKKDLEVVRAAIVQCEDLIKDKAFILNAVKKEMDALLGMHQLVLRMIKKLCLRLCKTMQMLLDMHQLLLELIKTLCLLPYVTQVSKVLCRVTSETIKEGFTFNTSSTGSEENSVEDSEYEDPKDKTRGKKRAVNHSVSDEYSKRVKTDHQLALSLKGATGTLEEVLLKLPTVVSRSKPVRENT